jgi:uncharacterized protein with GYD domain
MRTKLGSINRLVAVILALVWGAAGVAGLVVAYVFGHWVAAVAALFAFWYALLWVWVVVHARLLTWGEIATPWRARWSIRRHVSHSTGRRVDGTYAPPVRRRFAGSLGRHSSRPCRHRRLFHWPHNFVRRIIMATYIVLTSFTDQGVRNAKDTTKRSDAVKELAKKFGVTAKEFYWTLGSYDVVGIFEAPDDASMTALGLAIGAGGNVRTQTLRAFSREEMNGVLAKLA